MPNAHAPLSLPAGAAAAVWLLSPSMAHAAGGTTFIGVLLWFLAASFVVLLVWAAYFFSPVHRHLWQQRRQYRRLVTLAVGVAFLAAGVASLVTGESCLLRGAAALRAVEPEVFWLHVRVQLGAALALIVIGLLMRPPR